MKKKLIPELMMIIIVSSMVLLSELFHEKEFIFPEITALAIGAWLAPKQVWKTNRIKLVILIGLYAILGVILVRYVDIADYFKVLIGFIICCIGLFVSKTTFAPLLSATILPVIMGTESWVYPIFATVMAFFIVIGQYLLEKYHYRKPFKYVLVDEDLKITVVLNIKRICALALISIFAFRFSIPFLIAPPLIVAFVELSANHHKLRSKALTLWGLVFIMSLLGSYSRLIFSEILYLPLTISALVAVIGMVIVMRIKDLYFPPAGALAILPLLISVDKLAIYPFVVGLGFAIFTIMAFMITRTPLSTLIK